MKTDVKKGVEGRCVLASTLRFINFTRGARAAADGALAAWEDQDAGCAR